MKWLANQVLISKLETIQALGHEIYYEAAEEYQTAMLQLLSTI
jgi:hypothetical protein